MAKDEITGKITSVTRMGRGYMVHVEGDDVLAFGLSGKGAKPHRGQALTVRGQGVGHAGGQAEEIYLDGVRQYSPWDEYHGTPDGTDDPDYS